MEERTYGEAKWSLDEIDRPNFDSTRTMNDLAAHIRELLAENAALKSDLETRTSELVEFQKAFLKLSYDHAVITSGRKDELLAFGVKCMAFGDSQRMMTVDEIHEIVADIFLEDIR